MVENPVYLVAGILYQKGLSIVSWTGLFGEVLNFNERILPFLQYKAPSSFLLYHRLFC